MQKLFFEKVGFSISRKQRILEEACNSEFLEHLDARHHWYRKSEIETLNKYYNSIGTKELVNILNNTFWNRRNIRNVSGIYTKVYELKKANRWYSV
jgi:hypothetical protein